ncbi:alanine racemase [Nitrosomonas mobilis]|uniref:Alanine racemase n=1 Tax=Nitrosomonas mobilis TaxID=51642 RepID=A0A1G5SC77_9PROT|nr:alanine racemase [Nitrosomonas mobilis]SCZ84794.1 Alanine racemase [Nitrosomonas mobilis]HNO75588.1 alanine racemase [Nitrosomonas mobilis]
MFRPIQTIIDTTALQHNLAVVRQKVGHARTIAVIKADAYGHGLLHSARALSAANAFAVLELEAAVKLRDAGFQQPIILLEGFFSSHELDAINQYRLSTVIHHHEQLSMLSAYRGSNKLAIFLKINTGMNRLGFKPKPGNSALHALKQQEFIGEITLMTHFACADDAAEQQLVIQQLNEFSVLRAECGIHLPCSLANSAAILRYPQTHADWVRPGLLLYGVSPLPEKTGIEMGLRPAMTLTSQIIAIQKLSPGDRLGYGAQFTASQAMRIGIVAAGYADGYPRHAPTGTPVLVNGQRTRIVGRISMDMLSIDLQGIDHANIGSTVTLWGRGLPVEQVATAAQTISYELLAAISPRVPRCATP